MFIIVRDKEKRKRLSVAAMGQPSVAQAPIVIAACGTKTEPEYIMSSGQYSYPIDVAIAIDHMSLEAVEQGLGTCWIGAYQEDQVKQILGVPKNIRVVVMLTLGYPAESPSPRPRKNLEELVSYDSWQD